MKVIDAIREFDEWQMADFLCGVSKEQITRCIKSINDKIGVEFVSLAISFDKEEMRNYLNQELGEDNEGN